MNKALDLLKKVEDDGRLKGKSMNAKVASIIFITSRQYDQPKTIKQILSVCQVSQKELNTCYKKIKEILP